MRKIFFIASFFISINVNAQIEQSFNLGVWGDPTNTNLNYVPNENPSDLYWDGKLVTMCFQNTSDSTVVSNFHLTEKTVDCPYTTEYKECFMTKEGFLIDFSGFYVQETVFITTVSIYYDGKAVGLLNYPTQF